MESLFNMSYSICSDLAILKTLGDMGDFNGAAAFQVGNGSSDLDSFEIAAGAQI